MGVSRECGSILRLNIGIMEKKMETSGVPAKDSWLSVQLPVPFSHLIHPKAADVARIVFRSVAYLCPLSRVFDRRYWLKYI